MRISAEHGEGMSDLLMALMPLADAFTESRTVETPLVDVDVSGGPDDESPRKPTKDRPLQVAVVGRPNAGKSTLVN